MAQYKSIYTKLAYEAVYEFLKTGNTSDTEKQDIPEILKNKGSCFVTFKSKKGKLKGCIGTIRPKYVNLFTEIIRNAVSAAVHDSRFSRIKLKELSEIKISVEVLAKPKEITDLSYLDPGIYGLIIVDEFNRRGVLLPNIDGIETVEKQISIVKKKAGISQETKFGLKYYCFETKKYN